MIGDVNIWLDARLIGVNPCVAVSLKSFMFGGVMGVGLGLLGGLQNGAGGLPAGFGKEIGRGVGQLGVFMSAFSGMSCTLKAASFEMDDRAALLRHHSFNYFLSGGFAGAASSIPKALTSGAAPRVLAASTTSGALIMGAVGVLVP